MFPTIDKRETGLRLRKIMEERGINVKQVQEYLGLACVQSVYHWLNGCSMPTIDNLYALSELFKVSIDEMVCGNRQSIIPKMNEKDLSTYNRRLYVYYVKLNKIIQ